MLKQAVLAFGCAPNCAWIAHLLSVLSNNLSELTNATFVEALGVASKTLNSFLATKLLILTCAGLALVVEIIGVFWDFG